MAHYNPIEFIVLTIAFVAVWGLIIWRNLRMKHRQEDRAGHKGHIMNSPGSIAGAMGAVQRGDSR